MLKKSLGQNLLTDHNIAKKIIKLIPNVSNINLVEIGPGSGDWMHTNAISYNSYLDQIMISV